MCMCVCTLHSSSISDYISSFSIEILIINAGLASGQAFSSCG